mmetsp:Transcript_19707/g.29401  ORF Transcript_19707/g.29401 Transcript_19707/m.29401 type:complete len:483 (-) Transcript_19707:878-2326(-)
MMMQQQRYCFLALAAFSSIVLTTIVGIGSNTVSAEEIVAAANDKPAAHDVNESNQDVDDKNISYDGSDLIEWITSNGGFIHPNARIGLDPTGNYRGVFVKSVGGEDGGTEEGIEEDELVCSIPWDLIVKPDNWKYNFFPKTNCDALHEMYHQFQLGDESKYAPYINYLKNQPDGRIPSEWSVVGKKLMRKILHQDRYVGLPPFNALYRFEEKWMKECNGEDTPLARSAFFQFTARDEDNLMVPFFDMHNHSNDPKKLNAIPAKPKKKGKPFTMRAIRDIAPGEQIIISYNRCHGCWFDIEYEDCETKSFGGTDFLFSQFGFVEDYPQNWFIPQYEEDGTTLFDEIRFCLDRDDKGELFVRRFGDNYSDEAEEIPFDDNVEFLKDELDRMLKLEQKFKNDEELIKSMPSYEWDTVWTYQKALVTAMSTAVETVEQMPPPEERDFGSSSDDDSRDHYDSRDHSEDDSEDDESSSDDGDSTHDEL